MSVHARPRLHLIVGITGVGKTKRSIERAEEYQAPVVVLDRVQCYPEMTTASGRPYPEELRGTQRIYLTERRVADGDLDAETAHRMLRSWVERLGSEHKTIILEGGSLSLLSLMADSLLWSHYRRSCEYLRPTDQGAYADGVLRRVRQMLAPPGAHRSLLVELTELWADAAARPFLEGVIGYGTIIAWCREHGVPVERLHDVLTPEQSEEIAQEIAGVHLAHSQLQSKVFEKLLAAWSGA